MSTIDLTPVARPANAEPWKRKDRSMVVAAGLAATAGGLSLKSRIALLIVLPTIHFSWGWGFWVGLLKGASGTIDRSRVTKKS